MRTLIDGVPITLTIEQEEMTTMVDKGMMALGPGLYQEHQIEVLIMKMD